MGLGRRRASPREKVGPAEVKVFLDTHLVIWVLQRSSRLAAYPWLEACRPWGVSPVVLLEIQYLSEISRLAVRNPEFGDRLAADRRFVVDEAPLLALVRQAYALDWTRDPLDRLIAAHSQLRRVPLCTTDRVLRERHMYLVDELGRLT